MSTTFKSDTYQPDDLLAGNAGLLTGRTVTIKSGQILSRGAVIGKDGDSKYLLSLSAATDGSETPDMVLAEDADASAEDTLALAYERGDFRIDALTIGEGHSVESIREGLRGKGIYLI